MDPAWQVAFLGVLALIFVISLVTAPRVVSHRFGSRTWRSMRSLLSDLEDATDLHAHGREARLPLHLSEVVLEGRLASGRDAQVEYYSRGGVLLARIAVRCDDAPELAVTREGLGSTFARWIGTSDIEVGDQAFDDRFLVKAPKRKGARRALARGIRECVEACFDGFHAEALEVDGGWLMVELPAERLELEDHARILELLDGAAGDLQRVEVKVRSLGGSRLAVGHQGHPRCAYCHDAVSEEDACLVACERCTTVLHGPCWDELARCPILGCSGANPERQRVR